jgi:hypothetical protein
MCGMKSAFIASASLKGFQNRSITGGNVIKIPAEDVGAEKPSYKLRFVLGTAMTVFVISLMVLATMIVVAALSVG